MKKDNKSNALVFIIVCTLFTSLGQIFWKKGADNLVLDLFSLITNWNLILGFVFYALGLILLVKALKYGDLSFVYPFISLSFIWVGLLSYFFLNEPITLFKWIAIGVIVIGVGLIGYGGDNHAN